MHGMNWKKPEDKLPEAGTVVAVLYQHPKEHKPLSCQIMFGEVGYARDGSGCEVQSNDFTGSGSWAVKLSPLSKEIYPDGEGEFSPYDEVGLAWIEAEMLCLPIWIPHDPHWK